MRARVDAWRQQGLSVAFIPTMGALHQGHISLVKRGAQFADRTVASIFVNPKQFAPTEDLAVYPRNEAGDLDLLQEAGCHLAYCPAAEEIYPDGFETVVSTPTLATELEGAVRPHFFAGVATIVLKLLNQCRPDVAVFGEKDYQQLLVIRRMTRDLDLSLTIVGAPTIREADGLAMSSRNIYLTTEERRIAASLSAALRECAAAIDAGADWAPVCAEARARLVSAGFASVDYFELRDGDDLRAPPPGPAPAGRPMRLLAAARLGRTRLIDNWPAMRPA